MQVETDLAMKLIVFLVISGLVLLYLTRPENKPRHRKWRD